MTEEEIIKFIFQGLIVAIPVYLTGKFSSIVAEKKMKKDEAIAEAKLKESERTQIHIAADRFRDDILARLKQVEDENRELSKQVTNLFVELSSMKKDYALLEMEKEGLLDTIAKYKRKIFTTPFPSWIKRQDGYMYSLCDAYEELLLKPHGLSRADYEKRFDRDIHGVELAEQYEKADSIVYITRKPWIGQESYINANGDERKAIAAKWETITVDGDRAIQGMILITRKDVYT
jgi:hypothetical protein